MGNALRVFQGLEPLDVGTPTFAPLGTITDVEGNNAFFQNLWSGGFNTSQINVYEYWLGPTNFAGLQILPGNPNIIGPIPGGTATRDLQINAAGQIHISAGGGPQWSLSNIGNWFPSTDAAQDIGIPSLRVRNIYMSGGVNGVSIPLLTYSALTNSGPVSLSATNWIDLTPLASTTFTPAQTGTYLVTLDGNGICGPTGSQFSLGLSTVPSNPNGSTLVMSNIISITIVANTVGYISAVSVIPLTAGVQYRLVMYTNVAGNTGTGRVNAVRIG